MAAPYYHDAKAGISLYLGDCRDVLPSLVVGAIAAAVTDPPYGIGFEYEGHDDSEAGYEDLIRSVVSGLSDLDVGCCFFWQAMKHADKWGDWFPPGFRLFAACKGFVQFRPTPVQFSWDPVVWWGTPRGVPSVYRKDYHEQRLAPFGLGRERIDHPCPRPLEQVEYVVQLASESGDLVLDPFLGSGTTALACIRTRRRCIGIEKHQPYLEVAVARVEEELSRHPLLDQPSQRELLA